MNLWVNQSTSQPCTKGKKMMIKNRKSMRFLAPLTLAAMICGTFSSVAFAQADGPVSQTVEGAGKIVTSPAEIPKGIGESTERNDPVTGTVRFLAPLTLAAMICGTFSSVAFAQADGPVSQTVEGAGKIVTG
jgi:hypothetical protein